MKIVGRKEQLLQIESLLHSEKAEFVAITGRRRVGKTFLIDQSFEKNICFQMTGIQNANQKAQLENFARKLMIYSKIPFITNPPKDWGEAFFQLRSYLELQDKTQKQVIFLDELPWINTVKSEFLQNLAHLWNDYLSKQSHFILIVCGSASSWLLKNITNDKGGLHNRITTTIHLQPFTLSETKAFLEAKGIIKPLQEIAKLYMILGGIPFYLDDVQAHESNDQTIERMCFSENGKLKNEYSNLYKALFANPENHERIVEALAGSQKGMLRSQIIEKAKVTDGGPFNRAMNDLLSCNFITTIAQFGRKKREERYLLNDELSNFYHQFMKNNNRYTPGMWLQMAQNQKFKIWLGYAFERLVLRHIPQLKQQLGISGVYTEIYNLYPSNDQNRAMQVDLLLDRKDNVINFCEIKHYDSPFKISKDFYEDTQQKLAFFRSIASKKQIIYTLITNQVPMQNEYSTALIGKTIVLEDLFH
jgi:uncharacterized protein